MQIVKRDKSLQQFDFQKIINAVTKAYKECNREIPPDLSTTLFYIFEDLQKKQESIDIEEVQDIVENVLMDFDKVVAKAYILYRDKRAVARSEKMFRTIASKLRAEAVENQNANLDEKAFGGRMGEATRVVTKE